MSNKTNLRRQKGKRTETGPRWESSNPGAGCNSTHVARAWRKRKRIRARKFRRTFDALQEISDSAGAVIQTW